MLLHEQRLYKINSGFYIRLLACFEYVKQAAVALLNE